jgi:hypothetical protein
MPAPEIDPRSQVSPPQQPESIRSLRRTYDTHLAGLSELHRRLTEHDNGTGDTSTESEDSEQNTPAPVYATGAGPMTFEQLHARTCRIAGDTLRNQLGMTNPEDIDDCLQSAYCKLWQRLRDKPDLFAGKPVRYIVQAAVFRCKAQRYAHLRHYRKLVYDADPARQNGHHDLTTHRLDTWIDLEAAITRTAQAVENHPALLLSLYTVITQASAQEIRRIFGYSNKVLTTGRHQVRAVLKQLLPDYGEPYQADDHPELLPEKAETQPEQNHRPSLAEVLLDDYIPRVTRNGKTPHAAEAVPVNGRLKQPIQTQIRPHQPETPDDPVYTTGWKH